MSIPDFTEETILGRRTLLKGAGMSLAALALSGGLAATAGAAQFPGGNPFTHDKDLLNAAKIAEALATTTYTGIITGPVFQDLAPNVADQNYFLAARDEEMYHYNLLKSATGGGDAPLKYYFPAGMFTDVATTVNILVTLEEAFIAAYMIGASTFHSEGLRLLAAQILGVECEHRVLARVVAADLGLKSTTGLSGMAEAVTYSNNDIYERTFGLHYTSQVVAALTPFLGPSAQFSVEASFDPHYQPSIRGLEGNPPS